MDITDEEMFAPETDASGGEIVAQWRAKFEQGVLTPIDIKKHWIQWVPKIYSPNTNESCLNWRFNEELAQKILFNVLEEFICNGDPSALLSKLSEMDKPSSICGRVFKMGEPTYSCRECGMDNTCVLCVDCFKLSEHRLHKYKMGTSQGGGCCDCGDVEAWKRDPSCDVHMAATKQSEFNGGLPDDLKERTRIAFEAILWYAHHLLSTGQIADVSLGGVSDDFFQDDTYCTILYNDEVHTFEQVISTLTRVLKCSQRTAIDFVTNIDREGRAVVKCSSFQHCNELKQDIEKYTSRHGNKPLKVLVSHTYVIAHQVFAMKLLSWIQNFMGHGPGIRAIFAQVALQPQATDPCIIKGILLRDSTLWKSARNQWQHILISGMLLEYEHKMELAKIFTKNYGSVIKDFIKDDHDHGYSISSLSVQLFTVPTVAHHLIAYEDVLYILLNTFMSECSTKCNKAGKLEFERSPSSHTFKRAHFMLYDLRYLLSSVPESWNDDLRKSFLHGLFVIMGLFTKMQGMDAVTRQVGQHMEYEPEWESAFNLHIRLAYCISLAIKWCSTDRVVLIKAYRAILKKLEENPCYDPHDAWTVVELADHSTSCIVYDVSCKPVSIHLPLSRFLAGLHLALAKYDLYFDGPEFQTAKPSPVQIMEPVLRNQVMIAQVHAGMWRRNGYALLNQLYFYHNVKCRTEMLDRDMTLLQMCASLIESNEFLIHVLYKFNLTYWANPVYEVMSLKSNEEDSMRQTISMVEEFLQLMIVVIGERYMPGISNVPNEIRIKKEIIQCLCIRPMSHSELNKIITEDVAHETALDDVIEDLAIFKKPTQITGKGTYELKDEFYDEYNVFFYHYTKEELSKSEERQRKRRKAAGELECCPPPKLLKLNESFSMIVNLLQCDVMLHVMSTVLERCNNLRARSFSELQLHKVLHLIGYALHEEESNNYPFFKFIQNASKFKIFEMLNTILDSPRVEAHKELLKWVLKKYKDIANQRDKEASSSTEETVETPTTSSAVDSDKERRAKLAALKRAKIMAQMAAQQKSFMQENAKLFEENAKDSNKLRDSAMDTSENAEEQPIALGPRQTTRVGVEQTLVCILCQEEEKVSIKRSPLVLAAFVQQSTVLCQHKTDGALAVLQDPLSLPANLGPAPHVSTCGHVMHTECWRKYFENVMVREHRRPYRLRHPASFDVDKQEFLCPLCECLSNTVLPLVPALNTLQPTNVSLVSFEEWLSCMQVILKKRVQFCSSGYKCTNPCVCSNPCNKSNAPDVGLVESSESETAACKPENLEVQTWFEYSPDTFGEMSTKFEQLFPAGYPELDINLKEMVQVLAQVTYTRGLNVHPHPTDKRIPLMAWQSLAYSTHAIEVLLRESNRPLLGNMSSRQRDTMESLVRIIGVLGSTWPESHNIQSHALTLLTTLFENPNTGPSILQWDSFGLLVALTFSLPSLQNRKVPTPIPSGGTLELHTLRLIFTSHIVRILILMDVDALNDSMDTETNENEEIMLVLEAVQFKKWAGISGHSIWKCVQDACIPFLRCCCLFYHYLTDVPAPSVLSEVGGDTFANMCTYLDLPQTPKELFFTDKRIMELVQIWCHHERAFTYLCGGSLLDIVREPSPVNRLIDLPNDYSELINMVSSFACPNSDEDSRTPTMCLVCGEILCSQSYCCQTEVNKLNVGACNYHAQRCGAGVGIFLRVRECEILMLATPHRGTFSTAPYLDEYGETDMGLRRGNPLILCPGRYKKLQNLWLSHCIHEEIARSIESSSHVITTQWHHL